MQTAAAPHPRGPNARAPLGGRILPTRRGINSQHRRTGPSGSGLHPREPALSGPHTALGPIPIPAPCRPGHDGDDHPWKQIRPAPRAAPRYAAADGYQGAPETPRGPSPALRARPRTAGRSAANHAKQPPRPAGARSRAGATDLLASHCAQPVTPRLPADGAARTARQASPPCAPAPGAKAATTGTCAGPSPPIAARCRTPRAAGTPAPRQQWQPPRFRATARGVAWDHSTNDPMQRAACHGWRPRRRAPRNPWDCPVLAASARCPDPLPGGAARRQRLRFRCDACQAREPPVGDGRRPLVCSKTRSTDNSLDQRGRRIGHVNNPIPDAP